MSDPCKADHFRQILQSNPTLLLALRLSFLFWLFRVFLGFLPKFLQFILSEICLRRLMKSKLLYTEFSANDFHESHV